MRSIFVMCNLYDPDRARLQIDRIKELASKCQEASGTTNIVLQPLPLRGTQDEYKSDEQLKYQAEQLDQLGAHLASMGLDAAYHNLEAEFACAAREFHHMFAATDPENLSFCVDPHRIYRGTGNSQMALLDIIKLYGSRVSEVHFRQSANGVWSESFGVGDLDYSLICDAMKDQPVTPHLVYEQACESGSPKTMTPLEAHTEGRKCLQQLCNSTFGT
jgi:inosose dehydratase